MPMPAAICPTQLKDRCWYGVQPYNNTALVAMKDKDEWRAFRHDTEAGRLLARLYGVDNRSNTTNISYPKIKKQLPNNQQQPLHHDAQWRSVGAPHTRDPTDKRYDRAKAAKVPVPKFGRNKIDSARSSAVDRIPHRRSARSCSNEVANGRKQSGAYRPPRQNDIYSEAEKEKLSEINTYRGGKILPTDLTHPVAPLPSEIEKRQREADRLRKSQSQMDEPHASQSSSTLFDQILNEINERRAWQSEMEVIGEGGKSRQKTVEEISARVKELHRIDKVRAQQVLIGEAM